MTSTVEQTASPRTTTNTCVVRGEELLQKVKDLIHEGNAKRIIVLGEDDKTILEIPLTAGVVSAVVAPALVAIGAIAALAKHYTIRVEMAAEETHDVDDEC